MDLNRLMNLPLTQPLRLTTELVSPSPEDASASLLFDPSRRAAVLAAEEQVLMREREVRIAKSAYRPNITLTTLYSRMRFPEDPIDFDGKWHTFWIADVNVSMSIFEGGKRAAEVQRARLEEERARLRVSQLRRAVHLEFEQARLERARALSEIDSRKRNVVSAEQVYELTMLRYEREVANHLEVTDARFSLLQARTNLTEALADYYIADAEMARAAVGADPGASAAIRR
jgi:outer membrane protein TolC